MTRSQDDMTPLLDALVFAFASVAVTQLGRRPSLGAVAEFRRMAAAALERHSMPPPPFEDEDTEPRTARRGPTKKSADSGAA